MKIIDINSTSRDPDHQDRGEVVSVLKRNTRKWYILGFCLTFLAASSFYFLYLKEANNLKAQDLVFQSIYHFESGAFDKALKGDGCHQGFLEVIKKYPYTATANLACFYVGVAYMHQKEYDRAISFLSKFNARDFILQARAWCVMGDAYSEQKNHKQAAIYYMKAARYKPNKVYTPGYLLKSAIAFEANSQYKNAYSCYQEIVEKYPTSQYGSGLAIKEASRLSGLL